MLAASSTHTHTPPETHSPSRGRQEVPVLVVSAEHRAGLKQLLFDRGTSELAVFTCLLLNSDFPFLLVLESADWPPDPSALTVVCRQVAQQAAITAVCCQRAQ